MAKPRISHPENRKEVYKFWLGVFEKIALILVTVVILPYIIGQLQYPPLVLILSMAVILFLFVVMLFIGRKIWYLPKEEKK